MKVGFIGYGNMASSMLEGLLRAGVLSPSDVIVSSRTVSRMLPLTGRWPGIETTGDNRLAARKSDLLFICVTSERAREVLDEVRSSLPPSAHVVMINGGVRISDLQNHEIRLSKVIPSVTAEVARGVTLMQHGDNVADYQKELLERMFTMVGSVMVIDEDRFEVGTSMTSCGPAFVATFIEQFATAAAARGGYTYDEALSMVTETVLATASLISGGGHDPSSVCDAVATKGGITEKGLEVLRRDLPETFKEVMDAIVTEHKQVHGHSKES